MSNQHYQDQAESNASTICKDCKNKVFPHIEDNTQGFDLGSRLRGSENIQVSPACEECPEGCEPGKCSREIIVTAEELHEWLVAAKKIYHGIEWDYFDTRQVDFEILIDKIKNKLEES